MEYLKKVSGHVVRVGGTQHTGWLPGDAAEPLPEPVRDLAFDIEILSDGASGYILYYESQGGELYGDTWHRTLEEAESEAADRFGVRPEQWQDASCEEG